MKRKMKKMAHMDKKYTTTLLLEKVNLMKILGRQVRFKTGNSEHFGIFGNNTKIKCFPAIALMEALTLTSQIPISQKMSRMNFQIQMEMMTLTTDIFI